MESGDYMSRTTKITGIGSAFPDHIVTNDMIVAKLAERGIETSDQWITERTGMSSDPDNPQEYNSALGTRAAILALEMAQKSPQDIDLILYATCSPDTPMPSSACWLQGQIGATNAWGMDINAACSGFLYGLATADQFIKSGGAKTILVVGAEVLFPYINWDDRSSCILFGDGAGAALIEPAPADDPSQIFSFKMQSDGTLWDLLHVPGGGSRLELTPERYEQKLHKIQMNGRDVFKNAVRKLVQFGKDQLETNGMTVDELDWLVPHQANRRIIDAVVERLGVPEEKVLINVDRYGNTSAATVPTVLDEAVRDGRVKRGDTLLMDVFGAGLTYGAMLLRW